MMVQTQLVAIGILDSVAVSLRPARRNDHVLEWAPCAAALAFSMLVLLLSGLTPAHAQSSHKLFGAKLEISIPDSYVAFDPDQLDPNKYKPEHAPPKDPTIWFVRKGGRAALDQALPGHTFDDTYLERWLFFDVRAIVRIFPPIPLVAEEPETEDRPESDFFPVPPGATALDVHTKFCKAFSEQWGKYSFAHFNERTGIGVCVNVAGAFVAVFTKKAGDVLLVVEAMDRVALLVTETRARENSTSGGDFTELPSERKWQQFKETANSEVVEQLLLTARYLP